MSPASTAQTPERSRQQRLEALREANAIRSERAQLKARLRRGEVDLCDILSEPPEFLHTAKVCDFIRALPQYGPVKTTKLLDRCRVSSSKTIVGLTPRQRSELVEHLRA